MRKAYLGSGRCFSGRTPPKVACRIDTNDVAIEIIPPFHSHKPQCRTSRRVQSGTSSLHFCSRPVRLVCASTMPYCLRHDQPLTCPDPHNLQIHRVKAHAFEDQKAPEICRQTGLQTRLGPPQLSRTPSAKPRGADCYLHPQDL